MNAKIEEKHIKGLVFRDSIKTVTEVDGRPHAEYTPTERPLSLDDVISSREAPEGVWFTTADGKKYFWDRRTGKTSESQSR